MRTHRRAYPAASILGMLFACYSSPGNSSSTTGTTSAGSAISSASGSGGTTGGPPNVQGFLGTWFIATGNGSATFTAPGPDGGSQTSSTSTSSVVTNYSVTFTSGGASSLASTDSGGCRLSWSVAGNTATLMPGQSCTVSMLGGDCPFMVDTRSSSVSLTVVDANHLSGSGNAQGTLTAIATGPGSGCSVGTDGATAQASGTLVRAGS